MKKKDRRTVARWSIGLVVALMLLPFAAQYANASKPKPQTVEQGQGQAQDQSQQQGQGQQQGQSTQVTTGAVDVDTTLINTTAASATAIVGTEAAANNEGVSLSTNTNYEASVPSTVLVPNNNTATCISVFGFSVASKEGSAMFGIPLPANACNFEAAADDAFAAGERELGWFWKCHIKTLYKPFKEKGETKADAIDQCHTYAVGEITAQRTIRKLREQLAFSENERGIERQKCTESKNRISKSCWSEK